MRKKRPLVGFGVVMSLMFFSMSLNAHGEGVPTLDELAGDWQKAASLRNLPAVNNFVGGLKSTRDICAVQWLTFPPFSQGWESCRTFINDKEVYSEQSRWFPYQVARRTRHQGLEVSSFVRMVADRRGVLILLKIKNPSSKTVSVSISQELRGRVRRFDGRWNWSSPRPNDGEFAASKAGDSALLIKDKKSSACTAYAFSQKPAELRVKGEFGYVAWKTEIKAGAVREFGMVLAVGDDAFSTVHNADVWSATFKRQFEKAKTRWAEVWNAAFTPGNSLFSGNLPELVTDDDKIRRVYYMGIMSALHTFRERMPQGDHIFVTAGPQWATTLTYFWDAALWSEVWAMLDPVYMKRQLKSWLSMDYHRCYARDYISGQGSGPWYSANDRSIYHTINAYIQNTGDYGFLDEVVNGKTVLKHLEAMATFYHSRVNKGDTLADYGGSANLLECVPTYIHRVPSFNAANVWMLRRTAEYYKYAGNQQKATALRAEADRLQKEVMKLYVPGQGVWSSLHRDGKKVEMRHVLDFIVVGQDLGSSLSDKTKHEMLDFVKRELVTDHWMRAQSLSDPAAAHSDRPDHGPMGSYDAWPALSIAVMCDFGDFDYAVDYLRRIESVTLEGPFAQSHELMGRENNAVIRIANRGGQDFNENNGTAFSETIINALFGYRCETNGEINLLSPAVNRGFNGKLINLPHRGKWYTIVSDKNGLKLYPNNCGRN